MLSVVSEGILANDIESIDEIEFAARLLFIISHERNEINKLQDGNGREPGKDAGRNGTQKIVLKISMEQSIAVNGGDGDEMTARLTIFVAVALWKKRVVR